MLRKLGIVVAVALLAAGCGVRNSKPFTAKATASCLAKKGFSGVTTSPDRVGFVAGFAPNGGLRAVAPSGKVVTIAFAADAGSVDQTLSAFREHATGVYKRHFSDVSQTSRNAVLVWSETPQTGELDTVQRCLAS